MDLDDFSPNGPDPQSPVQLVYLIQAIAWFLPVLWLVAALIVHLKRDDVAGTWLAQHYAWQWRTVWFGLLWFVLMLPLAFLPPLSWLAYGALSLWLAYRVIRGWLRLREVREPA